MSLFPEDAPYRVLARKYRPADFQALIGQDAMVQTLANAIAGNRLAQAWLLTGVRGVGKTSTARLIAKALNCVGPDGSGGPTMSPCGECANCIAITQGQHIDVIEMDAASNTGVDNIREIIEAVRYASTSARYKIYIVDEVHMLSKGAFNALLKTLEEPPPHVKFIFATTEVQKVPATILSRCQRFDLKRIPVAMLADHFAAIARAEAIEADADALLLIARAADGSVRDGLSILDQAIALSGGHVRAESVRDMLGLADRGRTARLLGAILAAEPQAVLQALADAHGAGVDPEALFADLLDLLHAITRARFSGEADAALGENDRAAVTQWAAQLGFPALNRLWQMTLKGHGEIVQAPVPQQAAEMAALRIVHAAALPDPETLAALLDGSGAVAAAAPARASPQGGKAPETAEASAAEPVDFAAIIAHFIARRDALLAKRLTDDVALVALDLDARYLSLAPLAALPPGFAAEIANGLLAWTGENWRVEMVTAGGAASGAQSIRQVEVARAARDRSAAVATPLVAALLDNFPGAELISLAPDDDRRSATA